MLPQRTRQGRVDVGCSVGIGLGLGIGIGTGVVIGVGCGVDYDCSVCCGYGAREVMVVVLFVVVMTIIGWSYDVGDGAVVFVVVMNVLLVEVMMLMMV